MIPVAALRVGVLALVAGLALSSVSPLVSVAGAPTSSVVPAPPSAGTSPPPTAAPVGSASSPSVPGAPASVPSTSGTPVGRAQAMAATALAQTRAAGLSPQYVFLPRPSATPAEVAKARELGAVQPLYNASPAPMGLAYYGLSKGPGGRVVASVLNTTSLIGVVDLNSTGIQADDLFQGAPDGFAVQLNAVLTNVTLFGTTGYSFWVQNVVEYYPTTGFVDLVTNIWNFSGGPISAGDFYQLGSHGAVVGTEYYLAELPLGTPANPAVKLLPFDLQLWLNSTLVQGRDAVNITAQLHSPSYPIEDVREPYDSVVFNSISRHDSSPLTAPAPFTASGRAYNPVGLTDDFELTVGGPGGGSQATLFDADANLGLGYWYEGGYVPVPSAYSYGGESAETSTGADVTWASGPSAAPWPGLIDYGTMSTGPAVLTGLWGAGGRQGSYPVAINVQPANAFTILTPVGAPSNFTENGSELAPDAYASTFYLAPGNYTLLAELADYDPASLAVNVTGPLSLSVTLTPDFATGIYTPLWAFSNPELGALATSGLGSTGAPYVMPTYQPAPLSGVFGLYNPYGFPAYPGVFFQNTTATVEIASPPSFATVTNVSGPLGAAYPSENDLQYWFSNASNVALLDATNISGWFGASTFYPAAFNPFSVVFYGSTDDLVANDTFASGSGGLLVYAGVRPLQPGSPLGGSGTTIWGNRFERLSVPPVCSRSSGCDVTAPSNELGLEIAGAGDTVYNNAFRTPTTAWVVPMNLYTEAKEVYPNLFNITPQPASNILTDPEFPSVDLTGSIVGTADQGGNYWWDYGLAANPYNGANDPYGQLPYDEKATTYLAPDRGYYPSGYYDASYIYPGGDAAPLVPFGLAAVTLSAKGLPKGTGWLGTVANSSGVLLDDFSSTGTGRALELPNGSYTYAVAAAGVHYTRATGAFVVNGSTTKVVATFYALSFVESGLPAGLAWTLVFNGTLRILRSAPYSFVVGNGSYPYLVQSRGAYVVSGTSDPGTVVVAGKVATETITFVGGHPFVLSFHEKGLPKKTSWCVALSVETICSSKGAIAFKGLPAGSYPYAVLGHGLPNVSARIGISPVPTNGTIDLLRSTAVSLVYGDPHGVVFREAGLPVSDAWSVTIGHTTISNSSGVPIVYMLLNGSYRYTVSVSGPTVAGAQSGKFVVAGSGPSIALKWYPVTFNETGLANGTSWCVTVGAGTACSNNASFVVYEGNGSYAYHVHAVKGYRLTAPPTKVTVDGAGATVSVTFAPKSAPAPLPGRGAQEPVVARGLLE